MQLPNGGPTVKAVREEFLRNVYYFKRGDLGDVQSKGKAFRRQLEKAITEEVLVSGEIDGGPMVWLPSKP